LCTCAWRTTGWSCRPREVTNWPVNIWGPNERSGPDFAFFSLFLFTFFPVQFLHPFPFVLLIPLLMCKKFSGFWLDCNGVLSAWFCNMDVMLLSHACHLPVVYSRFLRDSRDHFASRWHFASEFGISTFFFLFLKTGSIFRSVSRYFVLAKEFIVLPGIDWSFVSVFRSSPFPGTSVPSCFT